MEKKKKRESNVWFFGKGCRHATSCISKIVEGLDAEHLVAHGMDGVNSLRALDREPRVVIFNFAGCLNNPPTINDLLFFVLDRSVMVLIVTPSNPESLFMNMRAPFDPLATSILLDPAFVHFRYLPAGLAAKWEPAREMLVFCED